MVIKEADRVCVYVCVCWGGGGGAVHHVFNIKICCLFSSFIHVLLN